MQMVEPEQVGLWTVVEVRTLSRLTRLKLMLV